MMKLPVGMQTFKEIVENGYIYVDKTQYIFNLINGVKYYFLSRPRRFGKSLLLDTIGEVFHGDKELFKKFWIYDSGYDFIKYPVIKLDMSNIPNDSPEMFQASLLFDLKLTLEDEKIKIADDGYPPNILKGLIRALHKKYGQKVVVLVDEYDKPILDHIDNREVAEANRQILRGFYGIIKSLDPYLRFVFITGVSKFTKTSIFSGLNNLSDITMSENYANICGIAVEDLNKYFRSHIENLSEKESLKHYECIYDEIIKWYDGYSWDGKTKVLNPFSLLNFLFQERFYGFWYASGTPKFLLDIVKKNPEAYANRGSIIINENMLDSIEIDNIAIEPLLFQTGYLTVKNITHTASAPVYILDTPNFEVKEAFNLHIISALTDNDSVKTGRMRLAIDRALHAGDLRDMLEILRGFFASIPYNLHIDQEAYYHSIFFAFMNALGFDMSVEVSVSKGRIDAVLELDEKVYIMEFKYINCPHDASDEKKRKLFDDALSAAVRQLIDRGYSGKYKGSCKTIYQAAFAFLGRGEIEMTII